MQPRTPIPISRIREIVETAIKNFPELYGDDRSTVSDILSDECDLAAIEARDPGDSTKGIHDRIPLPEGLAERYDALYAEWRKTGNFPWRLEIVTVERQDYYLGYVSDCGLSSLPRNARFERIIYLYPAAWFDANA